MKAMRWIGAAALAGGVHGELMQWGRATVEVAGPTAGETGEPNPFLDYRMTVTFRQGDKTLVAPGDFAADGNAAETGATAGNVWRAELTPDAAGRWDYEVSFRAGKDVAIAAETDAGEA